VFDGVIIKASKSKNGVAMMQELFNKATGLEIQDRFEQACGS